MQSLSVYLHLCICICVSVYVYMYMYMCIRVYVYMYMYMCICVSVSVSVYAKLILCKAYLICLSWDIVSLCERTCNTSEVMKVFSIFGQQLGRG